MKLSLYSPTKGKAVPAQAIKAYKGIINVVPPVVNVDSRSSGVEHLRLHHFACGKERRYPLNSRLAEL